MRDIALTVLVFGLVPVIFKYPWYGVLASAWISLFSPHRLAWGFAYDFQFAMIVALATMLGMLFNPKEVRFPVNLITVLLVLLPLWMTVTLLFALEPLEAYRRWEEVMKTFLLVLISAALLHTRKQLEVFLWVLVLSVGFYGVKGGVFTIVTGGGSKVWGPEGSYIYDNNAISVALIMIIPLMYYLSGVVSSKWVRLGLFGAMFLSGMAVLGSYSRGAFLAILAMAIFLWLKSRQRFTVGVVLIAIIPLALAFMPREWTSRMETIETFEKDGSAMGRINTWTMALNLAKDRPLVGGGFEPYSRKTFDTYGPTGSGVHSAHSIYFQMLGEHGYVGFGLFLCFAIASWILAGRVIRASRERPDCAWASNLARAIQVSLVGFAVGGAFVNISYWDLQYYEIVILMAAYRLVRVVEPKPDQDAMGRKPGLAVT